MYSGGCFDSLIWEQTESEVSLYLVHSAQYIYIISCVQLVATGSYTGEQELVLFPLYRLIRKRRCYQIWTLCCEVRIQLGAIK